GGYGYNLGGRGFYGGSSQGTASQRAVQYRDGVHSGTETCIGGQGGSSGGGEFQESFQSGDRGMHKGLWGDDSLTVSHGGQGQGQGQVNSDVKGNLRMGLTPEALSRMKRVGQQQRCQDAAMLPSTDPDATDGISDEHSGSNVAISTSTTSQGTISALALSLSAAEGGAGPGAGGNSSRGVGMPHP
ncbi:unnamed protein product, partial [Discosporangium mesarthrocarpum]